MGIKVKLPEGFGGLSMNGADVPIQPDADGCVDVDSDLADVLVSHGGTLVAAIEAAEVEEQAEVEEATAKVRGRRKA
jgi:hypothetical protein